MSGPSILSDAERALLEEQGERLLALEERYGSQRAALEAHPELGEVARALQRARAQAGADALGIVLHGDGRPFPPEILADLELVFSRVLAEDDVQPLGWVTPAARLARLL